MRAVVARGRTRAPEGVPALAEALRDSDVEGGLEALGGLGRIGGGEAGEEILAWVGERGLSVPALPLQSALIQCCAERPQMLTPYVQHAEGPMRELLGRVLGEVATPSMGLDLLQFMGDEREELRAAAARAMSHAESSLAFDVLNELAHDPVWFVRLRAIVGLGGLFDPRAIPALLHGLTDSNRLVRLRAAEALVKLKTEMVPIFQRVVATRDRYGLHAYFTALENADLRGKLENEAEPRMHASEQVKKSLQKILQLGTLNIEEPEMTAIGAAEAESLP